MGLLKPAHDLPHLGPRSARLTADVQTGVELGLFVLDAVAVGHLTGNLAGFEKTVGIAALKADHDHDFGFRVAIAALPQAVRATDDTGQAIRRAVVARQNSSARLVAEGCTTLRLTCSGPILSRELSVLLSAVAGLLPARNAMRLTVREVLVYE